MSPADTLADLLDTAMSYRRADSPTAEAVALTLLAMHIGVAVGCTPAEVKEQLELMRAPTPELRIRSGSQAVRAPKAEPESIDAAVARVVDQLRLTKANADVPWATEEVP